MQLLLPGLRIWLDVDSLDDIGQLETAVTDAAVIVVFLSRGYFSSRNCRREIYAALHRNQPVVCVLEVRHQHPHTRGMPRIPPLAHPPPALPP
jgi:nucleoside-triphosphatase THEP1